MRKMKIKLSITIDNSTIDRNYSLEDPYQKSQEEWGEEVWDMLDSFTSSLTE